MHHKHLIVIFIFILSSCASDSLTPSGNNEILPLATGNSWRYARQDFYRGELIAHDTLVITVLSQNSSGSSSTWNIIMDSPNSLDTIQVKKSSDGIYSFKHFKDSAYQSLVDLGFNPMALFLSTHSQDVPQHLNFSRLTDTTYQGKKTTRIREHVELLRNDSTVALYLDFDHSFVPGIGEVSAHFVSDITQCLVCNLQNEFWVYELVDYRVK
jgi:hypothetical protein